LTNWTRFVLIDRQRERGSQDLIKTRGTKDWMNWKPSKRSIGHSRVPQAGDYTSLFHWLRSSKKNTQEWAI